MYLFLQFLLLRSRIVVSCLCEVFVFEQYRLTCDNAALCCVVCILNNICFIVTPHCSGLWLSCPVGLYCCRTLWLAQSAGNTNITCSIERPEQLTEEEEHLNQVSLSVLYSVEYFLTTKSILSRDINFCVKIGHWPTEICEHTILSLYSHLLRSCDRHLKISLT